MSTRATYEFKTRSAKTTVYIHYDGYPSGAANYLYQMLVNPNRGELATTFIRANPLAAITSGHERHGDLEYRYKIEGDNIEAAVTVYEVDYNTDDWRIAGTYQSILLFVERYQDKIQNYQPFKTITSKWGNKHTINLPLAKELLANPIHHLQLWVGKYEGSGNWRNCIEEAQLILDAFPELWDESFTQFKLSRAQTNEPNTTVS